MSQTLPLLKAKLPPRALAAAEIVRSAALILVSGGDCSVLHVMVDEAIECAVQERIALLNTSEPVAESKDGEVQET